MSNGAVVCLPLPEPPPVPASPPAKDIEHQIGIATAEACTVLGAAMLKFHATGMMTSATKAADAEKNAKLAMLELDTLGELDDFAGIAYKEGLCRLRKLLVAEFFQKHGAKTDDTVLSNLISNVLEISQKIVALEKKLRAN